MSLMIEAERLFQDGVRYNILMSKRKQKQGDHKTPSNTNPQTRKVYFMKPNEVIEKLKEAGCGVKISRKTLYNYEQLELIPKPKFRNSRTTDYPDETAAEVFASYTLLHGNIKVKPELIAEIRKTALMVENGQAGTLDEVVDNYAESDFQGKLWAEWLKAKQVFQGSHQGDPVEVVFRSRMKLKKLGLLKPPETDLEYKFDSLEALGTEGVDKLKDAKKWLRENSSKLEIDRETDDEYYKILSLLNYHSHKITKEDREILFDRLSEIASKYK